MIISFQHKGLRKFGETESTAGIQAAHAAKLRLILQRIHGANAVQDTIFTARAASPERQYEGVGGRLR